VNWAQIDALAPELKALVTASIVLGLLVGLKFFVRRFKKVESNDPLFYRVALSVFAKKTSAYFYALVAIYVGVAVIFRDKAWFTAFHRIFFLICILQLWGWARFFVEVVFDRKRRQLAPGDISKASSFKALSFVANLVIVVFLALFLLDNFGVNISTFVAGLGVGGIAVALAVQNILGDLLASITIILDKPFVVGDSITVGDFSGTIENIGVKTTRVRSVSGEQVIFPNGDLLQSRIRNFKRLYERRVVLPFGVTYETPLDVLEKIPAVVKDIISNTEDVRFDRSHFTTFGPSSLDFETVYFVTGSDYGLFMDRQQSINLAIARRLADMKVEFAYPTTTIYAPKLESLQAAASEMRKQPL
jgi:small-conductance mechanosensitive channel